MSRPSDRLFQSLHTGRFLGLPTVSMLVLGVVAGVGGFWVLFRLDPLFREAIAPWRTPEVNWVMEWLTALGQGWVLGAGALGMALVSYRRGQAELVRAGLVAIPALIGSGLVSRVIKIVVARPRPSAAAGALDAWWPSLQYAYNSFPSGHATSAFTLAAILAVAAPSGRWVFYLVAAAIAFSRVAVDAHFVSDVVAGGLLGWATGRLAMILAARRWPPRTGPQRA